MSELPGQQFTWGGAMDLIDNKLENLNLDYYVKEARFIDNLNTWKNGINCEFIQLDPTHEEIQSGQLFELKKI